eukprot:364912-Chlamydomonas_euryale.AAC.8
MDRSGFMTAGTAVRASTLLPGSVPNKRCLLVERGTQIEMLRLREPRGHFHTRTTVRTPLHIRRWRSAASLSPDPAPSRRTTLQVWMRLHDISRRLTPAMHMNCVLQHAASAKGDIHIMHRPHHSPQHVTWCREPPLSTPW